MLEHFIKAVLAENAILFDEEKFRLHKRTLRPSKHSTYIRFLESAQNLVFANVCY